MFIKHILLYCFYLILSTEAQFRYSVFSQDPDVTVDLDLRYVSQHCKKGIEHNRDLHQCNNDLVTNYKDRMSKYVMEWRKYVAEPNKMRSHIEKAHQFACCNAVHLRSCFTYACTSDDIKKINPSINIYHERSFEISAPSYPLRCGHVDPNCDLHCPQCHLPSNQEEPINTFHTNPPDNNPYNPNYDDQDRGGKGTSSKLISNLYHLILSVLFYLGLKLF